MKKYNYIITIIAIFTMACSADKVPDDILSEEQMVEAIVELEVTQALYKLKYANKDSVNYTQLVNGALKEIDTNQDQFNASLKYYARYPKKVESFYEKAITVLVQRQAESQKAGGVEEAN